MNDLEPLVDRILVAGGKCAAEVGGYAWFPSHYQVVL